MLETNQLYQPHGVLKRGTPSSSGHDHDLVVKPWFFQSEVAPCQTRSLSVFASIHLMDPTEFHDLFDLSI